MGRRGRRPGFPRGGLSSLEGGRRGSAPRAAPSAGPSRGESAQGRRAGTAAPGGRPRRSPRPGRFQASSFPGGRVGSGRPRGEKSGNTGAQTPGSPAQVEGAPKDEDVTPCAGPSLRPDRGRGHSCPASEQPDHAGPTRFPTGTASELSSSGPSGQRHGNARVPEPRRGRTAPLPCAASTARLSAKPVCGPPPEGGQHRACGAAPSQPARSPAAPCGRGRSRGTRRAYLHPDGLVRHAAHHGADGVEQLQERLPEVGLALVLVEPAKDTARWGAAAAPRPRP